MNSENSKTSDPHKLLFKLSERLRKGTINMLFYQILAYTIHGKTLKSHTKLISLKHQLQRGMINLNYLMDHILYQMFKINLNISSKNMRH